MNKKDLVLPKSYAEVCEEEMMYLTGGLGYNLAYATTGGAMAKAASMKLLESSSWSNISVLDLAAEIWFHAYAYYHLKPMQSLCSMLGYSGISNWRIWKSLANGIDVQNGLDTEKEMGISRYVIFRATYAYAVATPSVLI